MHALSTCVFCFSRNYHVFYYLLLGASEEERKEFKLLAPEDYSYLKQVHPVVLTQTVCAIWNLRYCCNSLLMEPAFIKTASFWILCCLHSQLNAHVVCCILMKHSLFSNTSFSRSSFHLPLLFTCLCVYFCTFAVFFSLYTSILLTSVFLL